MKTDPYESYRGLLVRWDHCCVLCGEPFDNMESITKEHLIPKSKGGCGSGNLAPSHFKCNQLRGDLSLIETFLLIQARKLKMGNETYRQWANTPVPNRRSAKDKKLLKQNRNSSGIAR